MLAATLDTLITYNPWTLTPATTLAEAARLLDETGVRHWPVVDAEGVLLGQFTAQALDSALAKDPAGESSIAASVERNVKPVRTDACPQESLARLLFERRRMLPVVDAGRVVGLLSTADYLRELSYGSGPAARELVLEHLSRSVETIDADATPEQASALIAGRDYLVVVQGDFPLAALSPATLMHLRVQQFARARSGAASKFRTLGQLLQSCPTIAPGRTLGEAAGLMFEHQLDVLAVANQAGHLQGVLTEAAVLRAIAGEEEAER
jgi:CBS domain-containing protein